MEIREHRGWYDRGYVPHFDTGEFPQMITYRLADALPRPVIETILAKTNENDARRYSRFEKTLDNGYGSCVLKQRECAEIVVDNLRFHDGRSYRLLDWVVMPNHVHVCYDRSSTQVWKIVKGWKSYTSGKIKRLLGTQGDGEPLWQVGYHDRYARDERHLMKMRKYILLNPVKAGLVDEPWKWPYSSIHEKWK